MMPNLPCLVQEGALLFARGSNAKQEDASLLRSLLHHCGLVEEGPEAWIDIHTGLSGSGVAFVSATEFLIYFETQLLNSLIRVSGVQVYLFAEALAEGAVKMGMPSALAHSIASQTVLVSWTGAISSGFKLNSVFKQEKVHIIKEKIITSLILEERNILSLLFFFLRFKSIFFKAISGDKRPPEGALELI